MWELRTAELRFVLPGVVGGGELDGPLLVCPTAATALPVDFAGAPADPVFAALRTRWRMVDGDDAPLLLCPRNVVLATSLHGLASSGAAVYLPAPLQLGLHWLKREMALRGVVAQAHLLALAGRLSGWLQGVPRAQRLARADTDEGGLAELGRRLQTLLAAGFAEKATLDDLAVRLEVSRAQLNRALRRLNGFSVARYRTELRLRHGATLLLDGAPYCHEVARRVGYAAAGQFSADFARLYGVPPSRLVALIEALIGIGDEAG